MRAGLQRAVELGSAMAPAAKWTHSEASHLTLAFLGEVDEALVPGISEALAAVAARHAPFGLLARGAGQFGGSHRPRVLWIGLEGALAALAALREEVELALVPFGYLPEERAFRPHLTLARARERRGDLALGQALAVLGTPELGAFQVSELILYQSHLGTRGATYEARARLPLQGQAF